MSYPDYLKKEIRRNEKDAALFASVGLGWLSDIASRKAEQLKAARGKDINKTA